MGPAEPVRPAHSAPGSVALGAGKRAAPAKSRAVGKDHEKPSESSRYFKCLTQSALALKHTHFRRLRWVDHLRSGVEDQPSQHGKTLPLLKMQKLSGHVALQESKVGSRSQGQEIETNLADMVKPISTKHTKKISRVWWHTSVIPATQEAEAGELLEPRRQKLQQIGYEMDFQQTVVQL
ncbi:hypothetical protein AAY473_012784 [Plecturocebus cupreus]